MHMHPVNIPEDMDAAATAEGSIASAALDPTLVQLVEYLAENVHDSWAGMRMCMCNSRGAMARCQSGR